MASAPTQTSDKLSRRRRIIRSFEAKSLTHRTFSQKVADAITSGSGTIAFLLINLYVFALWISLNTNVIPGIIPFDPYPFGFLTMVVSLEAIVLSVIVLLSQNRAAQIASLREELHLQVNLIAEEEITKVLELLAEVREKVGIKKNDPELDRMLQRIDTSYIERSLQKQIDAGSTNILTIITPNGLHLGEKVEKNSGDITESKEKSIKEKATAT